MTHRFVIGLIDRAIRTEKGLRGCMIRRERLGSIGRLLTEIGDCVGSFPAPRHLCWPLARGAISQCVSFKLRGQIFEQPSQRSDKMRKANDLSELQMRVWHSAFDELIALQNAIDAVDRAIHDEMTAVRDRNKSINTPTKR
jgi:hypothetical protein